MVEVVEGCLAKAVELGGTLEQAIQEFMGTLNGQCKDRFGYTRTVNKIIREVSYQERYNFYMSYMTEEWSRSFGITNFLLDKKSNIHQKNVML